MSVEMNMARQKRIHIPGGIHHVITRGLNGTALFRDPEDRNVFLDWLASGLGRTSCLCHGWVLMTNHVHLVIRTAHTSLSEFVAKVLTGYAKYFNQRYHRRGYLYQNRYKSILCQEESYFLELIRYVHLNPVRAGLISSMSELDRYPWSGHGALAGKCRHAFQSCDEVLSRFGTDKKRARAAYRRFIQDGWEMGRVHELSGGIIRRNLADWRDCDHAPPGNREWRGEEHILGDEAFIREVLNRAKEVIRERERWRQSGWDLKRLENEVCGLLSIPSTDLMRKGRRNHVSYAKALFAYWGYHVIGLRGTDIAKYLGVTRPSLSYLVCLGKELADKGEFKLIN